QFVATHNADLGFVALSQLSTPDKPMGGSRWLVPAELHEPIRQDAVLLKRGEDNEAARAAFAFLRSATARAIVERVGYGAPLPAPAGCRPAAPCASFRRMTLDLGPVWLTLKLAAVSVAILLALGAPLAWWLAHTRSRLRVVVEPLVALPLVLPPTALGFYLLILLSPRIPFGGAWLEATVSTLAFSFSGLAIASILYSLPFAVQPLQGVFEAIGRAPLEAAATLRASPLDAFLTVASPMALRGFVTAAVLSFAHTLGEFGVVL